MIDEFHLIIFIPIRNVRVNFSGVRFYYANNGNINFYL